MKSPAVPFRYRSPVIAFIAVMLFGVVGITRVMGWSPNPAEGSGDLPALDGAGLETASADRAGARCPGCSMIVSMRKIESHDEAAGPGLADYGTSRDATRTGSASGYEIVIRMADGSSRAIHQASPAKWRPGEWVIVIDGANPPGR
jgi:hypothetical protein